MRKSLATYVFIWCTEMIVLRVLYEACSFTASEALFYPFERRVSPLVK